MALLHQGDRATRDRANPRESRFAALFAALDVAGVRAEPAVWHDDFADEVRAQLLQVPAVLVWCNPIEGGRRCDRLDALLREVASPGPRLYHGPDAAGFQPLRQRLESGWTTQLRECVGATPERLPLPWDCDFLFGEPRPDDPQRFVLCEVNVSSLSPFPPASIAPLVDAVRWRIADRRR